MDDNLDRLNEELDDMEIPEFVFASSLDICRRILPEREAHYIRLAALYAEKGEDTRAAACRTVAGYGGLDS